MKLFEYLDRRGNGVYSQWYARLEKREQGALDAKLDTIRAANPAGDGQTEIPPNLFRGPARHKQKSYPNTYKLTVNTGNAALRPLACKGPIDIVNEWTILVPVIEVGNEYPDRVFSDAEVRRREIIADPTRRRELVKDDD